MTDHSDYKGFPRAEDMVFVGAVDKPIQRLDLVFGVLKVAHPDGTHSLLVAPDDRAELTGGSN